METRSTERVRRGYERPVLEDLGTLSELTAGGDNSSTEVFDGTAYGPSSSSSSSS